MFTQWGVFQESIGTVSKSEPNIWSRGRPYLYYPRQQINLPLRETVSVFQGYLLYKTSLKDSLENRQQNNGYQGKWGGGRMKRVMVVKYIMTG